jgi:CRP-like cAMP-binding protein
MIEQIYMPGEAIFREGDESQLCYVIESGHVKLLKSQSDGPMTIAKLGPGEIFGEMSLVDERPRSMTAQAIDEVHVQVMTYQNFIDMLAEKSHESIKYVRTLFERLRNMNSRVMEQGQPEAGRISETNRFVVTIKPSTKESARVVPKNGIEIRTFPFRVGRVGEHESDDPLGINDLGLEDDEPYTVSRTHFSIDQLGGKVVIQDRGSYLGTMVNGQVIGGHRRDGEVELNEGENEVTVGRQRSPYRFKVAVEKAE